MFVGETDNESFGGGTPMAELADRIASTAGPSGANKVRRLRGPRYLWLGFARSS